jgi:dephospho-CoA kinase
MSQKKTVIGLFGSASSGKDTIAGFIKDELGHSNVPMSSFAHPFKELAHYVLSIPYENLWGPSRLRNEVLPYLGDAEVWNKGFELLASRCGFYEYAVFSGIAPESSGLFVSEVRKGWLSHVLMIDPSDDRCAAFGRVVQRWFFAAENQALKEGGLSVRDLLQDLGTRGRKFDDMVWVRRCAATVEAFLHDDIKAVIVTDVRRENEVQSILDAGGEVWRLTRDPALLTERAANHESEQDVKRSHVQDMATRVIDNANMTLDESRVEVTKIIRSIFDPSTKS